MGITSSLLLPFPSGASLRTSALSPLLRFPPACHLPSVLLPSLHPFSEATELLVKGKARMGALVTLSQSGRARWGAVGGLSPENAGHKLLRGGPHHSVALRGINWWEWGLVSAPPLSCFLAPRGGEHRCV